jgi:four helix bundle protein
MNFHFEELKVWQDGMELSEMVYELTKDFPKKEQFGLTAQLRRAAISVPLNIAEGKGRYHKKEFTQFLYQARGSLYETIALIKLSLKLGYLNRTDSNRLLNQSQQIMSKLSGLISSLRR